MGEFQQVATIADRLREAMVARKIKQVDLVRATGINRSAISRYLSGEYEPKNKPIYELSRVLDVSEQWLMGYDVPMERTKTQKKNDALTDIVVRLRKDVNFRSVVSSINDLDDDKLAWIQQMLNTFPK